MINSFQKYMCSTCYKKDENKVKGYEKPKTRTAKQKKALMGFTQEY